jgi:hypothetical protein
LISEQTQIWQKWDLRQDLQTYYKNIKPLDESQLKKNLSYKRKSQKFFQEIFAQKSKETYMHLIYENLFSCDVRQNLKIIDEVYDFLGFSPFAVSAEGLKKYLDRDLKLNNPETYKYIPNANAINQTLGSDETGWLFE